MRSLRALLASLGLLLSGCVIVSAPQITAFTDQPSGPGSFQLSWSAQNAQDYALSVNPSAGVSIDGQATANLDVGSATSATVSFSQLGTYTVTLTASSPFGSTSQSLIISFSSQSCTAPQGALALATSTPAVSPPPQGLGNWSAPHVPGVVLYYPGRASLTNSAALKTFKQSHPLTLRPAGFGWQEARTTPGAGRPLGETLRAGGALWAQPEYLYKPLGLTVPPNNTYYLTPIGTNSSGTQIYQELYLKQLNDQGGWNELTAGGTPVVIASLDTGVYSRNNLVPNLVPQGCWYNADTGQQGNATPYNFSDNSHGTATLSEIAATTNNGSAIAGLAYNLVQGLPIQVFSSSGTAPDPDIAAGILYALGGNVPAANSPTSLPIPPNPYPARIITMSLGEDLGGQDDPYLQTYLQQAYSQGVLVFVASGDGNGSQAEPYLDAPAANPGVFAIGATDLNGNWASSYSNYGTGCQANPNVTGCPSGSQVTNQLSFVAPGTDVIADNTSSSGQFALWTGTSMSTPLVAAEAALWEYQYKMVIGSFPGLTVNGTSLNQYAMSCFQSASSNGSTWNQQTGYGLINLGTLLNPSNTSCY